MLWPKGSIHTTLPALLGGSSCWQRSRGGGVRGGPYPVGLASRPAEGLPASLAQKQRSLPAQSLEESPQRQGQLQREKEEH